MHLSFTASPPSPPPAPPRHLQVDNQGRPTLKFTRLLCGRTATGRITLKNNGILPAKARIEMPPHAAFELESSAGGPAGGEAFTVDSKRSVSYTVTFKPTAVGAVTHELRLRVANNPFEDYRCELITGLRADH